MILLFYEGFGDYYGEACDLGGWNVPAGFIRDPGQKFNICLSILSEELEKTPVEHFKHHVESYDEFVMDSPSSPKASPLPVFVELFQQFKLKKWPA